mgnify:FL=1
MELYKKLRERYHSNSGMYLNKEICADLEKFIDDYVNQRVVEEFEELKEKIVYYQGEVRCSIALETSLGDIDSRVNKLKK